MAFAPFPRTRTSSFLRASSISRCLGCRPPAPHRLEKPNPNVDLPPGTPCRRQQHRRAGSIPADSLLLPRHELAPRIEELALTAPTRTICAPPSVKRTANDPRYLPSCACLAAEIDPTAKAFELHPDRTGLEHYHRFAFYRPDDASARFPTSFRLGRATFRHLAMTLRLTIKMQQTDVCFPSPQFTSTRASRIPPS